MNHYDTLGISSSATLEEIKSAYKKLALKWHPDKWSTKPEAERRKSEEQFKKICEAYKALEAEKTGGDNSFFDLEEEIKLERENLKAEREQLREERITLTREKFAYNWICPEVGHQFENPPLDPNLWAPYPTWMEKMRKCGDEEINSFVKELWEAAEEFSRKVNEDFKRQFNNSEKVGKLKTSILNEIQNKFKSSKVSSSDLDSSSNSWFKKLVSLNSESELEAFKNQMLNAIEEARVKKNGNGDNNERDRDRRDDRGNSPNTPTLPLNNPNTSPSNSNQQDLQNNSFLNKHSEKIIGGTITFLVIFAVAYIILNRVKTKKRKSEKPSPFQRQTFMPKQKYEEVEILDYKPLSFFFNFSHYEQIRI